jgi:glutathione peroxidase
MPCNQFGAQEPGTEAEILEFVRSKYDVTFPMFAKIEVNGDGTCALYRSLKAARPGDIAWNFTKFLVDGEGNVVERFEPKVTPEEMEPRIRELLDA